MVRCDYHVGKTLSRHKKAAADEVGSIRKYGGDLLQRAKLSRAMKDLLRQISATANVSLVVKHIFVHGSWENRIRAAVTLVHNRPSLIF